MFLFLNIARGGSWEAVLTATRTTTNSITLEWSAPSAKAINAYNLLQHCKLVCEPTFPPPIAIHSVTNSRYTVTGLAPYTECQFYLTGSRSDGNEYSLAVGLSAETQTSCEL